MPSYIKLSQAQCQQLIDVLREDFSETEIDDAARSIDVSPTTLWSRLTPSLERAANLVEYANTNYKIRNLLEYFLPRRPSGTPVYQICQELLQINSSPNQQQAALSTSSASKDAAEQGNMAAAASPCPVFISYSRADSKWLEQLEKHLKPMERAGKISLWYDRKIEAGEGWKGAIEHTLATARIAIFLVSADFLASDFIMDHELPPILKRMRTGGATIIPIIVGRCSYSDSPLGSFQAINDLKDPLSGMSRTKQDELFVKVAKTIQARI